MIIEFKGDRLEPRSDNVTVIYGGALIDFAVRSETIQTLAQISIVTGWDGGADSTSIVPIINEKILVLEGPSYGDILGMMKANG